MDMYEELFNNNRYDDQYLDYLLSKITIGGSCYCKENTVCSYCAKGYN